MATRQLASRQIWPWPLALALVAQAAVAGALAAPTAGAGQAGGEGCGSALHIGPTHCAPARSAGGSSADDAGPTDGTDSDFDDRAGGVAGADRSDDGGSSAARAALDPAIEARIDEFLANYGKPPRAAVRALLDPSDANIRNLWQQQQATLAVAAYVAARMSALQSSRDQADGVSAAALPALAGLQQMRVTLIQDPADDSAVAARRALRQLALAAPAVHAGVAFATKDGARVTAQVLGTVTPPLEVSALRAAALDRSRLPLVYIEDLRNARAAVIDAHDITVEGLGRAIIALRGRQRVPDDRSGADSTELDEPATTPGGRSQ